MSETLSSTSPVAPKEDAPWLATIIFSPQAARIGARFDLGRELIIGREVDGRGRIEDGKMSRQHVQLSMRGAEVEIADLQSRNGVTLDGKRITTTRINKRAVLRVGDTVAVLERCEAPAPEDDAAAVQLPGQSPAFLSARHKAFIAARAGLSILLLGETGVGKERFAEAIHRWSGRSGGPFVAMNMATVHHELAESQLFGHVRGAFSGAHRDAPGAFVAAKGGVLFLDEIGDLSISMQPKLLRVLETREVVPVGSHTPIAVDVQIVAATNANLQREVAAETFRRDLYARLAGAVIVIPPLRERLQDIAALATTFLGEPLPAFSAGFVDALLLHAWTMNVRELKNAMARLRMEGVARLERSHLQSVLDEISPAHEEKSAPDRPAVPTRDELHAKLSEFDGNVARTARHFDRAVMQIYRWVKQHHLDLDSYRAEH